MSVESCMAIAFATITLAVVVFLCKYYKFVTKLVSKMVEEEDPKTLAVAVLALALIMGFKKDVLLKLGATIRVTFESATPPDNTP